MESLELTQLRENLHKLPDNDQGFAHSLLQQLDEKGSLSAKQWYWLERLALRAVNPVEPAKKLRVGDFKPVIDLFKVASKKLQHPRINLLCRDKPVALSIAGPRSARPGCVNVTNGKSYAEGTWYGRVTPDGEWEVSKHTPEEMQTSLVALLTALTADPAGVAAAYGKTSGYCCFCHSKLTDERSTGVGYGPVCASHWNLPWGDAVDPLRRAS